MGRLEDLQRDLDEVTVRLTRDPAQFRHLVADRLFIGAVAQGHMDGNGFGSHGVSISRSASAVRIASSSRVVAASTVSPGRAGKASSARA